MKTSRLTPLAVVGSALLALLVAGCGGGSDSGGSEDAARKKLEAGGAKLTAAKSFEVSLEIEVEEDGVSEEAGCVVLSVDSHKEESLDMLFYDQGCSDESGGGEVIAIGLRAWAAGESGSFTAARITREVADELDDDQTTDLQGLFEAAEDIEVDPQAGQVEEGYGKFVDVPSYSFKAPASAFPDSEDLGDTDVEFEVTLDRKGFLRELVLHGETEDVGATVTEKYNNIDRDLGIQPPAPGEVDGQTQTIRSRSDLEALVDASAP